MLVNDTVRARLMVLQFALVYFRTGIQGYREIRANVRGKYPSLSHLQWTGVWSFLCTVCCTAVIAGVALFVIGLYITFFD